MRIDLDIFLLSSSLVFILEFLQCFVSLSIHFWVSNVIHFARFRNAFNFYRTKYGKKVENHKASEEDIKHGSPQVDM